MLDKFPLIVDLAFILMAAGITSLICRALKLPILVGYLLAGLLTGPHFALFPNVTDVENIHTWSEIGVIFLLFALGLEFNFKSLLKVGKTGAITSGLVVGGTMFFAWLLGLIFNWSTTQSIFMGGMLSVSSTMIVVKAFEELRLKGQRFTHIVYGVEIFEDIVAILLLVILPMVAMSQSESLARNVSVSLMRVTFFMVIWFVAGIFLIPTFLRKMKKLVNDEILLVLSLALCLGMVLLADQVGLSTALGAFVIGSILGSTPEAHRIETTMTPIRNLFGAIFFVSVGMMAEPSVILQQWPMMLLVLVLVVLIKPLMGTIGVYLSGRGLEDSVRAGFSFGHIGEFSFIIASLGISLNVFESYIYPVVIAVSVMTTITTPYMIRLSTPVFHKLDACLPTRVRAIFEKENTPGIKKVPDRRAVLIRQFLFEMFVLVMLLIGIIAFVGGFLSPQLENMVEQKWPEYAEWMSRGVSLCLTLLAMMPFLSALILRKRHLSRTVFVSLIKGRYEKLFLVMQIVRVIVVMIMIAFVVITMSPFHGMINIAIAAGCLAVVMFSRGFLTNYIRLERQFLFNYNEAENAERMEKSYSEDADASCNDIRGGDWLSQDLKVASMRVDEESVFLDKMLIELNLRALYGLFIIRIERAGSTINIPSGKVKIELNDVLYIVGTKEGFKALCGEPWHISEKKCHFSSMQDFTAHIAEQDEDGSMLRCIALPIGPDAYFVGKTLRESGIAARTQCLVIGIEKSNRVSMNPGLDEVLSPDARLWVVGEPDALTELIRANLA